MKKVIENNAIGIFVSVLLALICFFLYKTLEFVGIDAKIMKGIELSKVITALQENGFEISETQFSQNLEVDQVPFKEEKASNQESRTELLKEYVSRLSHGRQGIKSRSEV